MSQSISRIEGIGPKYAATLAKANIRTVNSLLKMCCDKKGRTAVSKETGIDASTLLKWANMADLFRIKGVGEEYSELLERAGVDTVKELAKRKPDNLHAKMEEVNTAKKLVRKTPGKPNVADWVEQAKMLKPVITH